MGRCKYIEGGVRCGRECVPLSDYCAAHQVTAADELTIASEPGAGVRETIKEVFPGADGAGGGPPGPGAPGGGDGGRQ